jgi:ABC-type polysaccharide/polyol phosphate export permease
MELPSSIAPGSRYRRRLHVREALRGLWRSRELVFTIAERDIRVRYKQTTLGAIWALLTPVALMLVFSLFLQRVAHFDTSGVPYPLFAYLGLLPWTFFSTAISIGGLSLVANTSLLNKVYCPREVFPLASVVTGVFDMLVAVSALAVLFTLLRFMPRPQSVWIPVIFMVQSAFTTGATLVVSSLLVYLRDLRHAIPILLQLGLLATPVAYGLDVIPIQLQQLYVVLNPLAAVIDSYRSVVLLGTSPDWHLLGPAAISAGLLLVFGYAVFKRLETGFADVA